MRLAFFGSGAFGLPALETLSRAHTIVGVVTQPDRPAGRGSKLTPTPIGAWCQEHLAHIPLLKPAKVNAPEVTETIRAWPVDAWVVIAFGQKLGKALLSDRFAINLHASLLPRWRGAAPINAAILAGDTTTGNSIITLADRMDAGLVLGQSFREIPPEQTAGELHDLLAADGAPLLLTVLDEFQSNRLKPVTQDESLVTIAGKLAKGDGAIDFRQPADFLRRQIHALTPWPGIAVVSTDRSLEFKLLRVACESVALASATPGEILDAKLGLVACAPSPLPHTLRALRLLEVQPPGRRPMSWSDFARGRTIPAGIILTSAWNAPTPPPATPENAA